MNYEQTNDTVMTYYTHQYGMAIYKQWAGINSK